MKPQSTITMCLHIRLFHCVLLLSVVIVFLIGTFKDIDTKDLSVDHAIELLNIFSIFQINGDGNDEPCKMIFHGDANPGSEIPHTPISIFSELPRQQKIDYGYTNSKNEQYSDMTLSI